MAPALKQAQAALEAEAAKEESVETLQVRSYQIQINLLRILVPLTPVRATLTGDGPAAILAEIRNGQCQGSEGSARRRVDAIYYLCVLQTNPRLQPSSQEGLEEQIASLRHLAVELCTSPDNGLVPGLTSVQGSTEPQSIDQQIALIKQRFWTVDEQSRNILQILVNTLSDEPLLLSRDQ
jgi:hypothetical protein